VHDHMPQQGSSCPLPFLRARGGLGLPGVVPGVGLSTASCVSWRVLCPRVILRVCVRFGRTRAPSFGELCVEELLLWDGKAPAQQVLCKWPIYCLFVACLLLFFSLLVWAGFGRQRLGRQATRPLRARDNFLLKVAFPGGLTSLSS
jgi:hypothetical protein